LTTPSVAVIDRLAVHVTFRPDGSLVDNIEDADLVVGYLAEMSRPHAAVMTFSTAQTS
jgi:hypothetical protein